MVAATNISLSDKGLPVRTCYQCMNTKQDLLKLPEL